MKRESVVRTGGAGRKMRRRADSPLGAGRDPLACTRAFERACDNLSPACGRVGVSKRDPSPSARLTRYASKSCFLAEPSLF